MKVKLSDWASFAEICSGVAVVITLIFLVLGIRENTRVTRAPMYESSLENIGAFDRTIMADPDLVRNFEAFLRKKTADLQELNRIYIEFIVANQLRAFNSKALAADQQQFVFAVSSNAFGA